MKLYSVIENEKYLIQAENHDRAMKQYLEDYFEKEAIKRMPPLFSGSFHESEDVKVSSGKEEKIFAYMEDEEIVYYWEVKE